MYCITTQNFLGKIRVVGARGSLRYTFVLTQEVIAEGVQDIGILNNGNRSIFQSHHFGI
jgi:hypothetical protein